MFRETLPATTIINHAVPAGLCGGLINRKLRCPASLPSVRLLPLPKVSPCETIILVVAICAHDYPSAGTKHAVPSTPTPFKESISTVPANSFYPCSHLIHHQNRQPIPIREISQRLRRRWYGTVPDGTQRRIVRIGYVHAISKATLPLDIKELILLLFNKWRCSHKAYVEYICAHCQ